MYSGEFNVESSWKDGRPGASLSVMEWLKLAGEYATTLWNTWLWIVGGALTMNEISEQFFERSWELPRKHRFSAALTVLVAAQVGAYVELRQQHRAGADALLNSIQAKDAQLASLNSQRDRLLLENSEDKRRIADLQVAVARSPVPIDLRVSSGPLPTYILCDDDPGTLWEYEKWQPAGDCREVHIPWEDMNDVEAEVNLRVTVPSGQSGWFRVRLVRSDSTGVVRQTDQVHVLRKGDGEHVTRIGWEIPREVKRTGYRIEALTGSGSTLGGHLIRIDGDISLSRRAR